MFGLSQDTVNAILYGFLGFYKLVFIVFVLVPWIALVIMC
jgi:bacteriorhodopsin